MNMRATKLGPQVVQIGDNTLFSSDGEDYYRYSEGNSITRVRREHIYEEPIPKWLLHSVLLGDYLVKKCKTLVYASETVDWIAPVPGTPMTVEERERMVENIRHALQCLETKFEIL